MGTSTAGDGFIQGPRVLVFYLPAGTDPRARPAGDNWSATWVQRAALSCRFHGVPLALVTDGDHLTLVHAPQQEATGWGTWRASEFATEPVLLDSFRSILHSRRFVAVPDRDTPEALLVESAAAQHEVTDQLGFPGKEGHRVAGQCRVAGQPGPGWKHFWRASDLTKCTKLR